MPSSSPSQPAIAWISRGRLYVKRGDLPVTEIESDFARTSLEREMRQSQNNSWKGRSGVWGNMGTEPPGMAPWEMADPRRNIRFAAVAAGDLPNEIYYVLEMGVVGGLFRYDMELDEETRLMHRQGFLARDISRHPEDGQLAMSLPQEDGTTGLSITRHDGLFGRTITLSDSFDEAPCWLRDGSRRLVFQSSAIGRDEQGAVIGKSTYRIEQLDLETEEIRNLHEQESFDLLQPQPLNDGKLMFIRRPFQASQRQSPAFLDVAQDVLFFPFRLGRTFVHFFNFMSMAFSGKPLIGAGGPAQQRAATNPYLMLYGQAIDTRQAMARGAGKNASQPLVPKDWQLISRTSDGTETIHADSVLCFDVNVTGDIVFSDGRRIYHLAVDGSPQKIAEGEVVEKVVWLA